MRPFSGDMANKATKSGALSITAYIYDIQRFIITLKMNRSRNRPTDNIELQIYIGEYKLVISVPKETRVAEVLNMVRSYEKIHQQYGPNNAFFLGLASSEDNEIIDYWMTQPQFTFSKFKTKIALKAIYTIESKVDRISVNHFEFLKCLGEGACGSVFLVRSRITGQIFAMKRLKKESLKSEETFKSIFREQKILRTLPASNHTVKFHASFESLDHFNFLLDFYPGGELFVHLTKKKLSAADAKIYFCQILMAVEFLHRHNILYRDLKPENILVDIHGHLCIADFGLSKCGFKEDDSTNSHCGSPEYMAPEVMENKFYNFSSDFYSIGAILYELLSGLPPYYGSSQDENLELKLEKMRKMEFDLDSITTDKSLRSLIKGLLHPNPDLRITTFKQIKSSPWLAQVDWKKIEDRSLPVSLAPSPYHTYINQQFLDKQDLVEQMNQFENEKFESFQFFDFIMPQSQKAILGRAKTLSKEVNPIKKKSNGFTKEKSARNINKSGMQGNKGNISIALYEKQHLHRESRGDTATTSNSNASYEAKTSKNSEHKENLCFRKESSRKNVIKKVPSCQKIPQTSALNSHNVSECSHRKASGASKEKSSLTLKTRNTEFLKSKASLTPAHKSTSKEKSQKVTGFKKEQGYTSTRAKKEILPVSSYKIKLM